MSQIIILNGTSSVGKTSTARELQNILGSNWLYITMDHFLDMFGKHVCNLDASTEDFLQPNEGLYAAKKTDGTFDIKVGPLGRKMLSNDMYDAVESFLKNDWNIIFTVVQMKKEMVEQLKDRFRKYNPFLVYLYADVNIIIKREKNRKNRLIGHTINLLKEYDSQDLHDLQINTSSFNPKEVAEKIINHEKEYW